MKDVTVLDTNGKYSYAFFQFQMSTWLSYGKEFGATRENIHDYFLQMKVARSMLDNGGQSHWRNCAEKVRKMYGPYPDIAYLDTVADTS